MHLESHHTLEELERMARAGKDILECYRILAKTGEVIDGVNFGKADSATVARPTLPSDAATAA